jgi:acyl-CoA synthetase (AMP-forming)/AMP-acid ligase II
MALRNLTTNLRTFSRAGLLRPSGPRRLLAAGRAIRYWGLNFAGGYASAAARNPDRNAIVDDRGALTWAELDQRSNAVAHALSARGIGPGDTVGLLARNHRGFAESSAALAKLGTNILYLNTGFAGPQLREVLAREGAVALLHDQEYTDLVATDAPVAHTVRTWWEAEAGAGTPNAGTPDAAPGPTLDDLAAGHPTGPPPAPERPGRIIILTSGTTGTPKGAPRQQTTSTSTAVSMLDRIPYHEGDVMVIAAPLFHSWGFANLSLGLLLNSTSVLQPRFDPEATLAAIAEHRARVLVAVPVMLQRILDLPPEVRRRHDTSSLELVPLSGSSLPGDLATRWMDAFGDNIYNLYGSTEVGWATIATPADLRADPTTAGRPPLGTVLRILDDSGHEVPTGETGRIFVGSELNFEGYTGGGNKEVVDGLMSTGDTGHVDADGRLHVEGRDDEMIVSGGENVFPREVEDLLGTHPDIVEAAVVGVADDEFGQRLKAVVVARPGADLDPETVQQHVRDNLARFKVPREVVFTDALPRNDTGKILKRDLV